MWEPVGPLPAHVYWKRRWLALASVLGVVVVLVGTVVAVTGRSGVLPEEPAVPAAHHTELLPEQPGTADPTPIVPMAEPGPSTESTAPSTGEPTSAAATSTGPATGLSVTGVPVGSPVAVTEGGPETTDEAKRPDDTPRAAVPVPAGEAPPPSGPPACTNEMIAVVAEIDSPQHEVGDRPELRLVVVNISAQACVRDLDGALQEIVVWDRPIQQRLWSSNDCVNPSTQDLRTLVPGQPVAFAVTWSGLSSNPGCTAPRTRLPAGEYTLLTRVADKISGPTPFTLSPRT